MTVSKQRRRSYHNGLTIKKTSENARSYFHMTTDPNHSLSKDNAGVKEESRETKEWNEDYCGFQDFFNLFF